jgi:hypothetical protein
MPLEGEAKRHYQREYMRRQRAGLPTRGQPKLKGQCCSLCSRSPNQERIVIESGRGIRICESCVTEVALMIAAQRRQIELAGEVMEKRRGALRELAKR